MRTLNLQPLVNFGLDIQVLFLHRNYNLHLRATENWIDKRIASFCMNAAADHFRSVGAVCYAYPNT